MTYTTLIPAPARNSINTGLSAAKPATLINIFGPLSGLTADGDGEVKNTKIKSLLVTQSVGPFRVTGIRPAVESLREIFAEVKAAHPDLYKIVGTAGMLCYRYVRGSHSTPSNHAAGTAIDLTVGGILSPQGATHIPSGLLVLYGYFHRHKFFAGMGYNGLIDPMHWEASDQLLKEWHSKGII